MKTHQSNMEEKQKRVSKFFAGDNTNLQKDLAPPINALAIHSTSMAGQADHHPSYAMFSSGVGNNALRKRNAASGAPSRPPSTHSQMTEVATGSGSSCISDSTTTNKQRGVEMSTKSRSKSKLQAFEKVETSIAEVTMAYPKSLERSY
jgi:hypothetical protein